MFLGLTIVYLILLIVPIFWLVFVPRILQECSLCIVYYESYDHLTKPHKRPSYVHHNHQRNQMLKLSKLYKRIQTKVLMKDEERMALSKWLESIEDELDRRINSWEDLERFRKRLKQTNEQIENRLISLRLNLIGLKERDNKINNDILQAINNCKNFDRRDLFDEKNITKLIKLIDSVSKFRYKSETSKKIEKILSLSY